MAPRLGHGYGARMRELLGRYGDYVLAGLIGAVYLGEVSFESDVRHRAWSAAVALAFAASLAFRRRYPVLALLAGLAVIELDNTVLKGLAETGAFLVGIVIGIYSAGRYARGPHAVACLLIVLAAIPLARVAERKAT